MKFGFIPPHSLLSRRGVRSKNVWGCVNPGLFWEQNFHVEEGGRMRQTVSLLAELKRTWFKVTV